MFLILAFAAVLLARFPGLELHRAGRHAYLAYLMHVPVLGILWVVWRSLVGGPDDRSYLLFFLAAPVVVFALAVRLGVTLDRAPRVVQIALRGRIVEPAPAPVWD